jgi:hypothetical protein
MRDLRIHRVLVCDDTVRRYSHHLDLLTAFAQPARRRTTWRRLASAAEARRMLASPTQLLPSGTPDAFAAGRNHYARYGA